MIASVAVNILADYLQFVFYVLFLRQRRGILFWIAVLSAVSAGVMSLSLTFGFARSAGIQILSSVLGIVTQACVVGILAIGARRRVRDAAILLIPNCVMLACIALQTIASVPQLYAQPWAGWMRQFLSRTITWPFNLGAFQLVGDLEMLVVTLCMLRASVAA